MTYEHEHELISHQPDQFVKMISTPVIHTEAEALVILNKYEVDYLDPTNLIYVSNGVTGPKSPQEAVELYMRFFEEREIFFCLGRGVTSFAVYPNMEVCELSFTNNLTSFPVQPKMKICYLFNNKLTSFPVQPEMVECQIHNNDLTSFPVQPKMKICYIFSNKLTSFPVQPEMIECYLSDNKITSLPVQPKMKACDITPRTD